MSPSVSHAPWRGAAVGTVCEIAGVAFRISSADSESVPYYPLPSRRSRPLRPVTVVRPRRPGAPRAPRWRLSSRATPRATVSTRFIQQCRAHGRASSCAIVGGFRAISRQSERESIFISTMALSLPRPAICESPGGSPSPPALQSQVVQRSASPTQCATTLPLPLAGARGPARRCYTGDTRQEPRKHQLARGVTPAGVCPD